MVPTTVPTTVPTVPTTVPTNHLYIHCSWLLLVTSGCSYASDGHPDGRWKIYSKWMQLASPLTPQFNVEAMRPRSQFAEARKKSTNLSTLNLWGEGGRETMEIGWKKAGGINDFYFEYIFHVRSPGRGFLYRLRRSRQCLGA